MTMDEIIPIDDQERLVINVLSKTGMFQTFGDIAIEQSGALFGVRALFSTKKYTTLILYVVSDGTYRVRFGGTAVYLDRKDLSSGLMKFYSLKYVIDLARRVFDQLKAEEEGF